eukprot:359474-Chlamydomonas_euryale.AAC.5
MQALITCNPSLQSHGCAGFPGRVAVSAHEVGIGASCFEAQPNSTRMLPFSMPALPSSTPTLPSPMSKLPSPMSTHGRVQPRCTPERCRRANVCRSAADLLA